MSSPLIRPFPGFTPKAEFVERVVIPPLSSLAPDEWDELADDNPISLLHVMRSALSPLHDTDRERLLADCAMRMRELLKDGIFEEHETPSFYVYRLVFGDNSTFGIGAEIAIAGYADRRVARHETTIVEVEEHIVDHLRTVGVATDPVALAYSQRAEIDEAVSVVVDREPDIAFVSTNGLEHSLWVVDTHAEVASLQAALENIETLYITDGHHRVAASARLAETLGVDRVSPASYFLGVLFPDDQLVVRAFHRCVTDLGPLTAEEFVARLDEVGSVTRLPSMPAVSPSTASLQVHLEGTWVSLEFDPGLVPHDPAGRLEASLLQEHILGPILGITEPRNDDRLHFVSGAAGLTELLTHDECAAHFVLPPATISDVMAVADADQVMPPKSTWMEPKVHGGLVLRKLF